MLETTASRACRSTGVLRAFLEIDEYIHGARSMEAIVQMSSLAGKPRLERSSLPARQQLAVHVDADKFLASWRLKDRRSGAAQVLGAAVRRLRTALRSGGGHVWRRARRPMGSGEATGRGVRCLPVFRGPQAARSLRLECRSEPGAATPPGDRDHSLLRYPWDAPSSR